MKRNRRITVLALFFLGWSSAALAEENPIDLKQSQNAWVAWTDAVNGTGSIFVSRREGDKWGQGVQLSSAELDSIAPSVAIDSKGNPWVVWSGRDGVESSIYISRLEGDKWTREEAVTSSDDRDDVTPAIAFDRSGKGLVVWGSVKDTSSEIRSREWNGQSWGAEQTLSAEDATPDMMPSVAFTAEGKAVTAWVGFEGDLARIFAVERDAAGKWGSETVVTGKAEVFGEDLPTLKVEGESLRLFFEEENQFYASTLTQKGWTSKKLVDLSNAFYEVLAGLPGETNGRAWFSWVNAEGLVTSFRYNVVTHDLVLKRGDKGAKFAWVKDAVVKFGTFVAWVFEPSDAYAAKKSTAKIAFGDSIVAGRPGVGWVGIWAPNAINRGVPGQRAANLASRIKDIPAGATAVILCGTNDCGDGRATGDILNALNGAVGKALANGAKRCFLCTNIPRRDFAAGRVADLANKIKSGAGNGSIDTFKPLSKSPARFTIDSVGHLNASGAKKVGSLVRKKAK